MNSPPIHPCKYYKVKSRSSASELRLLDQKARTAAHHRDVNGESESPWLPLPGKLVRELRNGGKGTVQRTHQNEPGSPTMATGEPRSSNALPSEEGKKSREAGRWGSSSPPAWQEAGVQVRDRHCFWTKRPMITSHRDQTANHWPRLYSKSDSFLLFCLTLREVRGVNRFVLEFIQENESQPQIGNGGQGGENKWNFSCTVSILFILNDEWMMISFPGKLSQTCAPFFCQSEVPHGYGQFKHPSPVYCVKI